MRKWVQIILAIMGGSLGYSGVILSFEDSINE